MTSPADTIRIDLTEVEFANIVGFLERTSRHCAASALKVPAAEVATKIEAAEICAYLSALVDLLNDRGGKL